MSTPKDRAVANTLSEEVLAQLPAIPPSAKVGFIKAVGYLFGGVANYIAAWTRRPTQSVDDKTDAKSIVTQAVAKAAAKSAAENPELVEAAVQAWLPKELRRQENKAKVVEYAATDLSGEDEATNANKQDISDDWLNAFERYCEDASSDKMRQLWGRVLAGEVKSPGSFSKATIRFLSELDISIAKSFEAMSGRIIGSNLFVLDANNQNAELGELLELEAAGLISGVGGFLSWTPDLEEDGIFVLSGAQFGLVGHVSNNVAPSIQTMTVTGVGQQITKILPAPDERATLDEIAKGLKEQDGNFIRKAEITGVALCKVVKNSVGQTSLQKLAVVWGDDPFERRN